MDTPNQETRPRLYKAGGILTAVGVADPSFTLIEVGKAFGFLLSEACYESMGGVKLHLENVLWVRCARKAGLKGHLTQHRDMGFRPFDQIDLYRHQAGIFVVQDPHSQQYLPYPSRDPYSVLFLSKERHDTLRHGIEQRAIEQLLDSVGRAVQELPGISFDGNSIIAPASYASATGEELEHKLIEI